MKKIFISGLLGFFVVSVIVVLVYVFLFRDGYFFQSSEGDIEDSEGLFGINSQKIRNDGKGVGYKIDIVSNLDHERNDDGTWYIASCELWVNIGGELHFRSPYPQQNDLKEYDVVAFSAEKITLKEDGFFKNYHSVNILENISRQSVKLGEDHMSELSTPSSELPNQIGFLREGVSVTGVIMAIEIIKNYNPEPEYPDEFHIVKAVMKFADGKLYVVKFFDSRHSNFLPPNIKFPTYDAFGEGDIITVKQYTNPRLSLFDAIYESK